MSADRSGWRVSLPCSRTEAEALAGEVPALAGLEPPPVLVFDEPDPAHPDEWRLDAYFEERPGAPAIAAIRALVGGGRTEPRIEALAAEDWVTRSQAGLEPIRAGRFVVQTPAHAHEPAPAGTVRFVIEAGRAFGTGHHETTAGCLEMLTLMREGGVRVGNLADVGTGTGLLAFAARTLWPRARAIASDIDPVAVAVARENAAANAFRTGRSAHAIELVAAPGLSHGRLRARAPYDLIVANILAGPLVSLAPSLARALAPGGSLLLAGLLESQADAVIAAYARERMRVVDRIDRGDWPTLRLTRRRAVRAGRTTLPAPASDWAADGR